MLTVLHVLGMFVVDLFKSRGRLEAENLFLRHQLKVALRRAPRRPRLRGSDLRQRPEQQELSKTNSAVKTR
jgi:hypothetical protein